MGVIGEREASPENCLAAYELGKALSREGAILITGGLEGVMEAASKGAKEEGGLVLGILPGFSPEEANAWVDIPVVTGMGEARNLIIVRTARVIVAIGGEYGTLSEMAFALKMRKPVISLNSWIPERERVKAETLYPVSTVEEAVFLAWKLSSLRG